MSQLKLSGDASGTGIVTVAAPNTNSTYTVTLPAAAGTFAQTDVAQTFTGTQTFSGAVVLSSTLTANGNTTLGDAVGDTLTVNATATFNNADATIYGVRVGRGAGGVSTNTAVGASALNANTTGAFNTAVGYQALYASNRTADTNGYNTAIGYGSGSAITTGQKNTIIGAYNGNQNNLDIRTLSNYIVLSDGDGNPRVAVDDNGAVRLMTSNGLGNGIATNSKYYNGVANNATVAATLTNNGNYTNFIIEIEWVSKSANASAVSYFSTKRYISIQGGAVSVNTTINTDLTSNASLSVTASTNTITFTITNTAGSTVYGTLSVFVRGTGTDGLGTTRTTISFS